MDMVIQSGINFDAFGLAMPSGTDEPGMHARDMMQISTLLDSFAPISRPLYITQVEVPGGEADSSLSGKDAGDGQGGWDQHKQAEWLDQFYRIALGRTFIDGVIYSSSTDTKESKLPHSGLLTAALEPKESYVVLKRFRDRIFGR
jgi:hypothetical protein